MPSVRAIRFPRAPRPSRRAGRAPARVRRFAPVSAWRPTPERRRGVAVGRVLSVAAHLALAVLALRHAPRPLTPAEARESIRFIAPLLPVPEPAAPSAVAADAAWRAASAPWHPVGAAPAASAAPLLGEARRAGDGEPAARRAASTGRAAPAVASSAVYVADEVDREIERQADAAAPAYPEALRARGVEGAVTARFVVDERGRVDTTAVEVVESSDPLFGAAVLASMPAMRFTAARRAGRPVRQLAVQRFVFRLDLSRPAPARLAAPPLGADDSSAQLAAREPARTRAGEGGRAVPE